MKKLLKKALTFSLCVCMVAGMTTAASAAEGTILQLPKCEAGETIRVPIGEAQFIDDGNGNIIAISALGFGWDERMCISQVGGNQKDIYAATAGDLTWNLLVDGFIELGRSPIKLSGCCYAIR
ncbi:MAG: hypothetical protein RR846_10595 [Oscillospiraceae bacterium]